MSNAAGIVENMQIDKENVVVPSDIELTMWPGGKIVTEAMQNADGSQTRKVERKGGCITGITARLTKNGAVKSFAEKVSKGADEDLDFIFTLANGDKFSGSVFIVTTQDFWTNSDGKGKFDLYATNGSFNPVS